MTAVPLGKVASRMRWSLVSRTIFGVRQVPWRAGLDPPRGHQADGLAAERFPGIDERLEACSLALVSRSISARRG